MNNNVQNGTNKKNVTDFFEAHLERLDKIRKHSLEPNEPFLVTYHVIRGFVEIGKGEMLTKLSEYEIKLLWAASHTDDSLTQNRLAGNILCRLQLLARRDAIQKFGGHRVQVSAAIELADFQNEFSSYLMSIES